MPMQARCFVLLFVSFFGVVDFFCDEFQLVVTVPLQLPVEAGLVADVTLAGINGHFQEKVVLVAVDKYLLYFLCVAALFALFP